MSKISHLPKTVPPKELAFKIKVKGSVSKHPYEGDFVVKVPNTRDTSRIGVELAKINDGIPLESLDRSTANLNNAIAFLRVTLVQAPKWFTNDADDEDEDGMEYGMETMDLNVPVTVFKEANKKVQEWYKALQGQPNEEVTT